MRVSITGRAAVLALVLGMLAVSYAYPLRAWYDQHQERDALREETQRLELSVTQLETELRLWDDPEYVRAQARERLAYVVPGEIGFIVATEPEPETELGPDGLPVAVDATWYDRMWTSLRAVDQPSEGE
jgi:cell division protein FtsB